VCCWGLGVLYFLGKRGCSGEMGDSFDCGVGVVFVLVEWGKRVWGLLVFDVLDVLGGGCPSSFVKCVVVRCCLLFCS